MLKNRLNLGAKTAAGFLTVAATMVGTIVALPDRAYAQDFMSQAELISTIPGETIQSRSNDGTPWAQAYSKGTKRGKIKGVYGGERYDAQWYVEGDKWCENWGDGQACWSVERVDERSLRMYDSDGSPRKHLWVLQ